MFKNAYIIDVVCALSPTLAVLVLIRAGLSAQGQRARFGWHAAPHRMLTSPAALYHTEYVGDVEYVPLRLTNSRALPLDHGRGSGQAVQTKHRYADKLPQARQSAMNAESDARGTYEPSSMAQGAAKLAVTRLLRQ